MALTIGGLPDCNWPFGAVVIEPGTFAAAWSQTNTFTCAHTKFNRLQSRYGKDHAAAGSGTYVPPDAGPFVLQHSLRTGTSRLRPTPSSSSEVSDSNLSRAHKNVSCSGLVVIGLRDEDVPDVCPESREVVWIIWISCRGARTSDPTTMPGGNATNEEKQEKAEAAP